MEIDGVGDAAADVAGRARRAARGVLGGDLGRRLETWAAAARAEEAARGRSRERWLRQAAEEEATVTGVLADLAERGASLVLRTGAGRSHQGTVRGIGRDFVALRTSRGEVVVASASILVVRPAPGAVPVTGDRAVSTDLTLVEVLVELAAERERVLLVTSDGRDGVAGTLRSVGSDLVVVRPDGEAGAAAYVRLAAIAEVTLG